MVPYKLLDLPYKKSELAPILSEEQVSIHYDKHHKSYVDNANKLFEKIAVSRSVGETVDMKAYLKDLSFQSAGHYLHDLYWRSLNPSRTGLIGKIKIQIEKDFGSFEKFKKEFSQAALSVEGSGWAVLVWCPKSEQLLIIQIEKHNLNHCPNMPIIFALDVFEHAYYVDYRNDRAKYIENIWQIVDWEGINGRFVALF